MSVRPSTHGTLAGAAAELGRPRARAARPRSAPAPAGTAFTANLKRRLRRPLRARAPALRRRSRASTSAARWSAACAPWPSAAARPTWPPTARGCARDAGGARRVPRPRDDQRLAPVAPRGPVRDPAHEDPARARRARAAPGIWSAGCSYGAEAYTLAAVCREAVPSVRGRDRRHRPRPAHGRPRPRGRRSPPRTPARRRRRCCSAISSRSPTAAGTPSPSSAHGALRDRRPAAHAGPDRALRPRLLPQHRHLLHRGGPRRAARAARPVARARAATSSSARPSASPTRAGSGSPRRSTSSTGRADGLEYLPMFLAEGREHLQELNLAVVRIEETPDDRETVDEIFRIAHSLKGMSATMGFAGMAALTHEMEDVFELLRQRAGGLERAAIDVLLRRASTRSRPRSRRSTRPAPEAIEPQALIERLQSLVRERTPEQEAQRAGAGADPGRPAPSCADGRRVVQVTRAPDRGRLDAGGARLHGARRARRARRDAGLPPAPDERRRLRRPRDRRVGRLRAHRRRAGRRRRSACPRSPRRWSSRPISDAALDEAPTRSRRRDADVADASPPPRRSARRRGHGAAPAAPAAGKGHAQGRLLDRPRRRRAARPADALHGRARPAPHAGRGARRAAPTCPASRRRCRTSRAPRTRCRRWSCRSG